MKKWICIVFSVICIVLAGFLPVTTYASGDQMLLNQIREAIIKVRTGKTVDIRTNAAEQLASLTRKVDPKDVDDKVLADLISLLDTHDDSVRGWVAGAIGFLGTRARSAAPELLKVLEDADCVRGDLTSAGAIRLALKRIGVKPPQQSMCKAMRN